MTTSIAYPSSNRIGNMCDAVYPSDLRNVRLFPEIYKESRAKAGKEEKLPRKSLRFSAALSNHKKRSTLTRAPLHGTGCRS
jgi:hypothetical protein